MCTNTFGNQETLAKHLQTSHKIVTVHMIKPEKYTLSKEDCLNEEGWWVCKICKNEKFNFAIEIINHWKEVHNENLSSLKFTLLLTAKEIFEREKYFHENGWLCGRCDSNEKFEHKFQLVEHWQENHSQG